MIHHLGGGGARSVRTFHTAYDWSKFIDRAGLEKEGGTFSQFAHENIYFLHCCISLFHISLPCKRGHTSHYKEEALKHVSAQARQNALRRHLYTFLNCLVFSLDLLYIYSSPDAVGAYERTPLSHRKERGLY